MKDFNNVVTRRKSWRTSTHEKSREGSTTTITWWSACTNYQTMPRILSQYTVYNSFSFNLLALTPQTPILSHKTSFPHFNAFQLTFSVSRADYLVTWIRTKEAGRTELAVPRCRSVGSLLSRTRFAVDLVSETSLPILPVNQHTRSRHFF